MHEKVQFAVKCTHSLLLLLWETSDTNFDLNVKLPHFYLSSQQSSVHANNETNELNRFRKPYKHSETLSDISMKERR